MAKKQSAKPKKRVELFKTRKTREEAPQASDTLTPPKDVARSVDLFREAQEQAKHFEGEATVHKDHVVHYAQEEYAKRAMNGINKSFKVLGNQSMVTYVVMDASAGLTEEEVEAFKERWGEDAAEDLIMRDLGSVRFNADVLEANYDAVTEALQSLPEDVLENLFKPMLMKAKSGSVEKAKKYTKDPEELKELVHMLKIKNYIR